MHNKEKLESQQCRTCYNATKGLKQLTNLTKYGNGGAQQKSYAELLAEITKINILEDCSEKMPKFICDSCSRKLKAAHAFVQQTHEVNERLMALIIEKEVEDDTNSQLDCLKEAQVDIESCLEIKMEQNDKTVETEINCPVDLKLEVIEELPQHVQLEKEKLNEKLEADNGDRIMQIVTLKEMNVSQSTIDHSVTETIEDIFKADNSNSVTDLFRDNEKDLYDNNTTSDDDNDPNDNHSTEDMEWQTDNEQNKLNNKKNIKKINKKSNKSEEKIDKPPENGGDDDVAVPCTQCNKIFDNSKALARHQRTSHIPEDQKCTCPLCFRKFSRSCNMYTHMRTFHGPDTVPLIRKPSTEERTFQCDKCPRNYTKKKHLNIHIKNKHSQESESLMKKEENINETEASKEEESLSKSNKPKRYEVRSLCSICGSSFSSKTHLIVHMRRHTGERPFKCDLCDRAYPRISELTCHRRIHTGEKPFACKICGKTFRVSSKMTTHMRSHTDIRPYKCTQCERSFKYSKDLSIHFRIHTGERPYKCNICGSTFTQSNTLKAHRMKLGHMDNVVENSNNLV